MTVASCNSFRGRPLRARVLSLILTLLSGVAVVCAQPTGPTVTAIKIAGNQRVETDAIRVHITQLVGQPENPTVVDNDVKAVYKMGFFDDTHVDFSGGVLTFYVHERPLNTDLHFTGMKEVKASDSDVINALAIHAGAIYDPVRAKTTTRNITEIYQQKGYLDAQVDFKLIPHANNTAVGASDYDCERRTSCERSPNSCGRPFLAGSCF